MKKIRISLISTLVFCSFNAYCSDYSVVNNNKNRFEVKVDFSVVGNTCGTANSTMKAEKTGVYRSLIGVSSKLTIGAITDSTLYSEIFEAQNSGRTLKQEIMRFGSAQYVEHSSAHQHFISHFDYTIPGEGVELTSPGGEMIVSVETHQGTIDSNNLSVKMITKQNVKDYGTVFVRDACYDSRDIKDLIINNPSDKLLELLLNKGKLSGKIDVSKRLSYTSNPGNSYDKPVPTELFAGTLSVTASYSPSISTTDSIQIEMGIDKHGAYKGDSIINFSGYAPTGGRLSAIINRPLDGIELKLLTNSSKINLLDTPLRINSHGFKSSFEGQLNVIASSNSSPAPQESYITFDLEVN
ncbi:hypothetical protein [Photobacterium leiognathi]|uniref:hypothetical protein n=1 Tax=Photobacterium leiognathi TaxID=553611 RepID=UPI00273754F9|nr:hypothetical protein [Photobacterium leiognathi]